MVSTNTSTDQNQSTAPAHEEAIKPDRGPIASPRGESQALSRIASALQAGQSDSVKIVVGDGPALAVPPSLLRILQRGATTLAKDDAVTMGHLGKLLTIRQAAELLLVSYSDVKQLLDSGDLPSVVVGEDRRVPLDRLLAYQAMIARQRRASLLQLTRSSEAMGLYDLENVEKLNRFPEVDEEAES